MDWRSLDDSARDGEEVVLFGPGWPLPMAAYYSAEEEAWIGTRHYIGDDPARGGPTIYYRHSRPPHSGSMRPLEKQTLLALHLKRLQYRNWDRGVYRGAGLDKALEGLRFRNYVTGDWPCKLTDAGLRKARSLLEEAKEAQRR